MFDSLIEILIFIFVVLFIAFFVVVGYKESAFNRRCLRNGYPHAEYIIGGPSYCHTRINQTDIVIPEDSLRIP